MLTSGFPKKIREICSGTSWIDNLDSAPSLWLLSRMVLAITDTSGQLGVPGLSDYCFLRKFYLLIATHSGQALRIWLRLFHAHLPERYGYLITYLAQLSQSLYEIAYEFLGLIQVLTVFHEIFWWQAWNNVLRKF